MKSEDSQRQAIFDILAKITASDIMVPLSEVKLINKNMKFVEIINLVVNDGHSRFPVYENNVDNIVGVLYVKDLLKFFTSKRKKFNICEILRKPIFVPENRSAKDILKDFKEKRVHIAIVVNEYGTMLGIVSLEDIIEELVGEIEDEYDKEEEAGYKKIGKNEFIISPKMKITEFNSIFKTRISPEEFDTMGEFILESFGYVPKEGEHLSYGSYKFIIKSVSGSRIKEIIVRKE